MSVPGNGPTFVTIRTYGRNEAEWLIVVNGEQFTFPATFDSIRSVNAMTAEIIARWPIKD